MRRISYYLIIFVVIGASIVSFWVYDRYFKGDPISYLQFPVERGSVTQIIKARGQVVAAKEFDLEFPFSGTIERIYVLEGQYVKIGESLIKLETTEFSIEENRLKELANQYKANLDKLIVGPTKEEVNVAETKVANADSSVLDAQKNIVDTISDAYTKSDDAVRNRIDQFITNPKTTNPKLVFSAQPSQLQSDIEWGRQIVEPILVSWNEAIVNLSVQSDLQKEILASKKNLSLVKALLDNVALAVNGAQTSVSISQTTLDAWKASIVTARTNINTALANITASEEKLASAESALALAKDQLSLTKSGSRSEDIEAMRAQIKQVENQIASVQEKIRKSVITAPVAGRVSKKWYEEKELFRSGTLAISLNASGFKIQSDISELDIGKIRENNLNEVSFELDAFSGKKLSGKITNIEQKEIIIEGDKFYRINIAFNPEGLEIRSGMNADLTISITKKDGVLKIPALAIYKENGKMFTRVMSGKNVASRAIETGVSDGDITEIINGLSEGEIVAVLEE